MLVLFVFVMENEWEEAFVLGLFAITDQRNGR